MFIITLTNDGPSTARAVSFIDTFELSSGAVVLQGGTCEVTSGDLSCTIDGLNLAPGASAQVYIAARARWWWWWWWWYGVVVGGWVVGWWWWWMVSGDDDDDDDDGDDDDDDDDDERESGGCSSGGVVGGVVGGW